MIDKLTYEQLREVMESHRESHVEYRMATELLALRAERAKPTPSDEERAREVAEHAGIDMLDDHDLFIAELVAGFASIRAEGSAELAKLEAAIEWALSRFREVDDGFGLFTLTALAQPAESGATP